ncbi:hypothetical protein AALO_G00252340 [Alosa alosa]|uniref:Secreted protein n=1 Tax=Alosa alosa TaxID=278164 RepID=A0AAV6FN60_9TELE|nr:hypothetical protein AALO_G00252340 [Alosa alosa]
MRFVYFCHMLTAARKTSADLSSSVLRSDDAMVSNSSLAILKKSSHSRSEEGEDRPPSAYCSPSTFSGIDTGFQCSACSLASVLSGVAPIWRLGALSSRWPAPPQP